MTEAEDHEEVFRTVLELSDNKPDKPRLLDYCGACFLRSFLGHKNWKEEIDNCIVAYELAVHLTPHGHSDLASRMNMLGVLYYHRFNLAGDLADISEAIFYQRKALDLTPEGHGEMPTWLNNLGNSFKSRFECAGDLADISNAILYQQKVVNLTSKG